MAVFEQLDEFINNQCLLDNRYNNHSNSNSSNNHNYVENNNINFKHHYDDNTNYKSTKLQQFSKQNENIIIQNNSIIHADINNNSVNNNNNNNNTIESDRHLRILIFTESFYPYTSGISRRFIEIITRLTKRNCKIHIVTGTNNPDGWIINENDEELKANVTFGCLKAITFKNKIDCALPFLYPQFGIFNEILKFKPDVIHVVEHTPAAILCGIAAKIFDIPLICSSHTHIDNYIPLFTYHFAISIVLKFYRYVRKEFLNMANCNLTVSSDFVQLLKSSGVESEIHVWKTGVDSELFNPKYRTHETRVEMFNGNYSPEKILLVSVGRISPEKNFEFLLKIIEKFPKTFLCIIGDGPYREQIEKIFPKDRTHFMGFLQGEQLARAYASADYFIYASVSETFGQVYLEAMSSCVPVVAAEGTQMKEFFVNGLHGHTWNPGDVESAYKALSDTIDKRDVLSKNCRPTALKYSWDSSAEQMLNLYSQFKNYKQDKSYTKRTLKCVFYLFKWIYLMILSLFFMAPFVTRPSTTQVTTNPTSNGASHTKNNNNNKSTCKNFSLFDSIYKEFLTKTLYIESNGVFGAFLATLSALFLSLIFTTIYVCYDK